MREITSMLGMQKKTRVIADKQRKPSFGFVALQRIVRLSAQN